MIFTDRYLTERNASYFHQTYSYTAYKLICVALKFIKETNCTISFDFIFPCSIMCANSVNYHID